VDDYWKASPAEAARALGVSVDGLSSADADARLAEYGHNIVQGRHPLTRLGLLWRQLKARSCSCSSSPRPRRSLSREWADAAIVIAIVIASAGIGYLREYRAHRRTAGPRRPDSHSREGRARWSCGPGPD
jgi:Mg2+-importing ATPase